MPLAVAVASLLLLGCRTASHYKADADREAYHILTRKHERTVGTPMKFTIDPPGEAPLERLLGGAAAGRPEGAAATAAEPTATESENGLPVVKGAVRLSLRDTLELAARFSRDYQSRKEDLYLSALALAAERFNWRPQWTGNLDAGVAETAGDGSATAGADFGVSQLLAFGGQATLGLSSNLVRYATGDPRTIAASVLSGEVALPLWRGHGRLVAQESLTQAERDTAYAVRAFSRFRKTFSYEVTSRYYRVLQQRDAVINQWKNYLRNRQSRQDTEATAAAGERPQLEVDQARQQELSAQASWVRAVRQYEAQLDQFKVSLGLPVDAPVEVDPAEVDKLRQAGLREVTLPLERAVELALQRRQDLIVAYARVADAERQVQVASNGLGPDVDLAVNASVPTEGPNHAAKFQVHEGTYTAGLDVALPLRRMAERNTYRRALISLEQARRSADQLRDDVKLSVRDDWRNLEEAAVSHRIQRDSVDLAERRVLGNRELLRRGEATARDVLEANEALVNAQNALTQTVIDHTLARLALWRDTGLLRVGPDGVWEEITDVEP